MRSWRGRCALPATSCCRTSFRFDAPADATAEAARRRRGHRFSNRARTGHCPLDAPSVADQRARADPRARRGGVHPRPHERHARATSFRPCSYGDNIYPSFALEVARQHLGVPRDEVRLELGRGVWLGDRLVPTDDRTQFVVNYRGTDRFQTRELRAAPGRRRVPAADFEGKVVLIGGSAAGLGETFVTPFDAYCRGSNATPR